MSAEEHTFLVTVSGCSRKQARQVITERIDPDEDYGFAYKIKQRKIDIAQIRSICEDYLDIDTTWAHTILHIIDGIYM